MRAILAPYHARCGRSWSGTGAPSRKFIGDAVVGVFEAPDHARGRPERAVRAALAIQDAIAELNEPDPALALEVGWA